jgi:hypothetical protein
VLERLLTDGFAAMLRIGHASLARVAQDGMRAAAGAAAFQRRASLERCRAEAAAGGGAISTSAEATVEVKQQCLGLTAPAPLASSAQVAIGCRNSRRHEVRRGESLQVPVTSGDIGSLRPRRSARQSPPPQRYCRAAPIRSKLFPVRAETPVLP